MGARSAHELIFTLAKETDAAAIAALLNAAADHLTWVHGEGPWSTHCGERSVALGIMPPVAGMRRSVTSQTLIARIAGDEAMRIVGTLRVATKKPWAIDVSRFTPVDRALYLTGMAIEPALQRQGVGRRMLDEAVRIARVFPTKPAAQAIRLDAWDQGTSEAGAGGFYAACGWRDVAHVKYRDTPLTYFEYLL